EFFLVAFGSVMVKFSNYTYEPSLTTRPGAGKPLVEFADVGAAMAARLREMVEDCRTLRAGLPETCDRLQRRVIQDSIFNAAEYLPPASVDLAIPSPPYLNNYHYLRNTRPHLFWLKFIESTTDLRRIEEASFGKFWQTVRDGERLDLEFELPELQAVLDELR